MAHEIELKLAFPAAARAAVLRHPLLANAEKLGRAQTLINTYYDTPTLALSAKKVALRTRKAGKQWLQTVKCAARSQGGLSSRPEWEQAFSGHFDFSAVDSEPRALLEKHADAIVPLFSTNFRRETFVLTPRDGVRVLVMVDSGEVSAQGRSETISELELELDGPGTPDDLLALACELAATLPLRPYDASKAARGYRLFRNDAPDVPRRSATIADLQASSFQTFRETAFQEISVWAAQHDAALHGERPEHVRQIRLTLRRLHDLIQIFTPLLPASFCSHWQAALRTELKALGAVRDLHVLCELVLAASEGDSDARLPTLIAHAQAHADAAHTAARVQLAAPGAGLPLLALSRALHALPEPATPPTLAKLATQTLATHSKRARQRLAQAEAERSPAALHALRLAVKRLRYASGLFAPLFARKGQARERVRLARLQSALGTLNDLNLALPRLSAWAQHDPALREALAFFAGWHAATSLKCRQRILPRCAKRLNKAR